MQNNSIILGKLYTITADVVYAFNLKEFEEHQINIKNLKNNLINNNINNFSVRSVPFPVHYPFYKDSLILPFQLIKPEENELYKDISSDMLKFLYYKDVFVAPYNNLCVVLFDEVTL